MNKSECLSTASTILDESPSKNIKSSSDKYTSRILSAFKVLEMV